MAAPNAPTGGVYWVGADGNYYVKNSSGVVNMGSEGIAPLAGLTQIADPNPPAAAPANPNGATSGTATADKSNDIALQNSSLASVDPTTAAGLAKIDASLGSINGQYDTEAAANQANYKTQSDTNETNLQKNKESALLNAAQGRQGLFGTLSSLGALNGSGIDLANEAVQNGANADLTGAGNNFATNQSGLDTSIGTFEQEDKQRRADAATAAADAKTSVNNSAAKTKQTLYANLANDYAAQGDSANAAKFTQLAAGLNPDIASTSLPDTTNLAPEGAAYTPTTLANYLAGANSTAVTATPSVAGGLPGLVATTPAKKKLVTA